MIIMEGGVPYKRKEVIGDCNLFNFPRPACIYSIQKNEVTVYIGSTSHPIKSRIRTHISEAKRGKSLPIYEWIRKNNYSFDVVFIESVDENDREIREKYWITQFDNLLNLTDGGKGMSGHKFAGSEHAKKIGEKLRTGKYFNCLKCGTEFWRKQKDIIRGHNKYCSTLCSNTRHK